MKAALSFSALLLVAGCAPVGPAVTFHAYSVSRVVDPREVAEFETLPRGSRRLGRLVAHCEAQRAWGRFERRSLLELDCSEPRLRSLLREAALDYGGNVLAALVCEGSSSWSCTAVVGRTVQTVMPARGETHGGVPDMGGRLAAEVQLSFSPTVSDPRRPRRPEDGVRDLPSLPPSHLPVGSLTAACERCEERPLRQALLIASGQLGVSDVIGARCVPWEQGHRCAGLLAVAEREPDHVLP